MYRMEAEEFVEALEKKMPRFFTYRGKKYCWQEGIWNSFIERDKTHYIKESLQKLTNKQLIKELEKLKAVQEL